SALDSRHLPSFPTRRSSDLFAALGQWQIRKPSMPARSAPGSLAMARKINYGKNFIRHGWLLIGELELCDKLLGCQLLSSQSDDVFKPPQLADPHPPRGGCFHSCRILTALWG